MTKIRVHGNLSQKQWKKKLAQNDALITESCTSVNYDFIQKFRISGVRAFKWLTNFDPIDPSLMNEGGKRKVRRLSTDSFILTDIDTRQGITISKTRLVRIVPQDLSWTSTTIAGTMKYSQFLYRILPDGSERSHLHFVGLQLEPRAMTTKQVRVAQKEARMRVSAGWKYLAKAMEKELL